MRRAGFALALVLAVLGATPARADLHTDCANWRNAHPNGDAELPTVCLAEKDSDTIPLFEGLGATKRELYRDDRDVQNYFNQGLRFYYAFNFREAYRAFRKAAALAELTKTRCGYCYWGIAASLSVRPGEFLTPEPDRQEARRALTEADKIFDPNKQKQATGLVGALLVRTENCNNGENCYSKRVSDYHGFMRQFWSNNNHDAEITCLYMDAILGNPRGDRLAEGRAAIKLAMDAPFNETHTGLWYWYLHLMEASNMPGPAEAAADQRGGMAPNAGHMVHMPSHIYLLLGKPEKAVISDDKAMKADDRYFADPNNKLVHPDGDRYRYDSYPHVLQSLMWAALMRGQKDVVEIAAARLLDTQPKTAGSYRQDYYRAMYYLGRFPLLQSGDVFLFPKPGDKQPLATVAYRYVRLRATLWSGVEWKDDLAEFDAAVNAYPNKDQCPDKLKVFHTEPCLVDIMSHLAHAQVAAQQKNWRDAIREGETAAAIQTRMPDGLPGSWVLPVKQTLASFYLRAEEGAPPPLYLKKAEELLNESLQTRPGNGWAYFGLMEAAKLSGQVDKWRAAEKVFRAHWATNLDPRLDHM
ncbi:MAG: hypothetical protein JOZ72_13665 [Alphaproteobacteria bacterium]|nr:hypothetical protein [Alphaproteobacteria bacterium]